MLTIPAHAILLDMDGTLVDSDAVVDRLMGRWASAHGLDVDTVLRMSHGRQGHEVMAELLPDRPAEENLADNEELLAAEISDTDGIVEIPGAARLLAALVDVPHALVTSATLPLAQARMTAAGLVVPDVAVTADDVTESKPSPRGFLRAAEILGVDPTRCVVFEDSRAGIAAGLAAGATVIGVGEDVAGYGADHTVADLTSVHFDGESVQIHLIDR
ncbi:HAD-IA family hydrolase [Gordonia sp. HY002]|uniref:HAD-IA family hydrolase n=1 Tax=Gordonia zhenghanii TaxID=2911516 RepID=UPI001EF01AB4|nr:HAD-IA family hydrolase [Gordonia zhenghanii]MCF8569460.1 HAD-IA family hydrolase [Gordonia zhenghanii]MCF8602369.1 HAD-IA family hydrolase [Gordonia zhenghanii]